MLGAALHFLIAFSAASVFYGASRKLMVLTRRPVLSGVLYGVVVYLFMYWAVMPLSAYHKPPFSISATIIAVVTHIVCVVLPIYLFVYRYYTEIDTAFPPPRGSISTRRSRLASVTLPMPHSPLAAIAWPMTRNASTASLPSG